MAPLSSYEHLEINIFEMILVHNIVLIVFMLKMLRVMKMSMGRRRIRVQLLQKIKIIRKTVALSGGHSRWRARVTVSTCPRPQSGMIPINHVEVLKKKKLNSVYETKI